MEEENIQYAWANTAMTILHKENVTEFNRIVAIYRFFARAMRLHRSTNEIDLYEAARECLLSIIAIIEIRIDKKILFEPPECFDCCNRMFFSTFAEKAQVRGSGIGLCDCVCDSKNASSDEYDTFPEELDEWVFDIIEHSDEIITDLKYNFVSQWANLAR